jgi:hypothetical protein
MTQQPATAELREYDRSTFIFIFVLMMAFLLVLQYLAGDTLLKDPDTYWHIAVGQRIWQTGSPPYVDEFSFTFQGHPWMANEWLIDLLMFSAYNLGGWRALVLLTAFTIAATYSLLYLILSRELRLSVAVGVAITAYVFSMVHFLARPHVFAYPLIIMWFAGIVRAVETKTSPNPLLLAVMVVWANTHGSFTLGLGFAGALAAEAVFDSEPSVRLRVATRWAIFGAFALVAACVTPYGYEPILFTFRVLNGNESVQTFAEWRPMFGFKSPVDPVIFMTFLFLLFYYGVRVPFWRLLQLITLIWGMMSYIRLAPLFALITPILLVGPLTHQFPFLKLKTDIEANRTLYEALSQGSRKLLYPISSVLIFAAAVFGFFGPPISPDPNITPAGAVDYMVKEKLHGNIYNFFNFGGYLVFRGIKTFIDGRTGLLFTDGFIGNLNRILGSNPAGFVPLLQKHDISLALVAPQSIEAWELDRSPFWIKAYSDDVSSLYKRSYDTNDRKR